jgi:hypothetical protein
MTDNELRTAFNNWKQAESNQGASLGEFFRTLLPPLAGISPGGKSPLMKVWLVEMHDYDDYELEGIYADEAKARSRCALLEELRKEAAVSHDTSSYYVTEEDVW